MQKKIATVFSFLLVLLPIAVIIFISSTLKSQTDTLGPRIKAADVLCGNGIIDPGEQCDNGIPADCSKLGINYATLTHSTPNLLSNIDRATALGMGNSLFIVTDNDSFNITAAGDVFYEVISRSAGKTTPILRICTYDGCKNQNATTSFKNPQQYVNFLNAVAARIESRLGTINFKFLAIAGPNEPLDEPWLDGLSGVVPGPNTDYDLVAQKTAQYMNSVISLMQSSTYKNNIVLLSPAHNLTHPLFDEFITSMNNYGANWAGLSGIAGNAYNLKGYTVDGVQRETISSFVTRLRSVGFTTNPIYLTEIGMYEEERNPNWPIKVPHAQALANLSTEVEKLRVDPQVKAYLLFDSFGTNPDPAFLYNNMTDTEIKGLSPDCYKTPDPLCVNCQYPVTNTVTPTLTSTPVNTSTPTLTPTPTIFFTFTPTLTPTAIPTLTQTPLPTNSPTPTTVALTPLKFKPIADTFVEKGKSNTNFGAWTNLQTLGGQLKYTYMKFDLSAYSNKRITSALLKFNVVNPSVNLVAVKLINNNSWTEGSLTYANQPLLSLNNGINIAYFVSPNNGLVSIDITPAVISKIGGQMSLVFVSYGSDNLIIQSKESGGVVPLISLNTAQQYSCIGLYKPVCGKDGKTYGNSCEMSLHNTTMNCAKSCPCF